jgi:hypothetical protein
VIEQTGARDAARGFPAFGDSCATTAPVDLIVDRREMRDKLAACSR